MRYALRNQDKIKRAYSQEILDDMIKELDLVFKESGIYKKWDQEKGLYFLETRKYSFYTLGIKYDVFRLALRGIKEYRVIHIPIKPWYAGDYRIEYDGKYITLYGKDMNYESMFGGYEEMILIPIVEEVRNVEPVISEVTGDEIIIILKQGYGIP